MKRLEKRVEEGQSFGWKSKASKHPEEQKKRMELFAKNGMDISLYAFELCIVDAPPLQLVLGSNVIQGITCSISHPLNSSWTKSLNGQIRTSNTTAFGRELFD